MPRSVTVVREAAKDSERLVEALLTLAQSSGPIAREPLDLGVIASAVRDDLSSAADRKRISIRCDANRAPVLGDPSLLRRLAFNLVDNAIRHNIEGGWVIIRTSSTTGWCDLAVQNGGAVIEPTATSTLFERFRRLRGDRNRAEGLGLGLAIVLAAASAYGGTAHARALSSGGLEVQVRVPAIAD